MNNGIRQHVTRIRGECRYCGVPVCKIVNPQGTDLVEQCGKCETTIFTRWVTKG